MVQKDSNKLNTEPSETGTKQPQSGQSLIDHKLFSTDIRCTIDGNTMILTLEALVNGVPSVFSYSTVLPSSVTPDSIGQSLSYLGVEMESTMLEQFMVWPRKLSNHSWRQSQVNISRLMSSSSPTSSTLTTQTEPGRATPPPSEQPSHP